MAWNVQDRVPIPPRDAQQFTTVCQYCIVGCGYKVYKWPVGREGGPQPSQNAFGQDFTKQLPALVGAWASPNHHAEVVDRDGRRYNVIIVPDHDCVVNQGLNSTRGGTQAGSLYSPDGPTRDRLTRPLIYRGNDYLPTTWEESTDLTARVIKAVIERMGPDGVAMKTFDHGGGGGGYELTWASGKFFFTGVGTRMCAIHNRPAYNSEVHSSRDMGVGELNNAYEDAELADTIMLIGANSYENQTNLFLVHMVPNLGGTSLEKKRRWFPNEPVEAGRMIIVDPRRTMTVEAAERAAGKDRVLHLDLDPGTDIALMNGLFTLIAERGWDARAFVAASTEKYDEVRVANRQTLAETARLTRLPEAKIVQAAEWIAKPKAGGARPRVCFYYEKGIIWGLKNYENVASIVNVALQTHNVGRPGTGCCRVGGHQEGYVRPDADYPGGRPAINVDRAINEGQCGVYWIAGCDPGLTTLNAQNHRNALARRSNLVKEAMDRVIGGSVEQRVAAIMSAIDRGGLFVPVSNLYMVTTARYAHVVFPAANWGEFNITSMNGERRMRLYEKFMDPPGIAKPDWEIYALVARRLRGLFQAEGTAALPGRPAGFAGGPVGPRTYAEWAKRFEGFAWKTDEEVFEEGYRKNATGGQHVTYARLRAMGTNGFQEPAVDFKDGKIVGTRQLYTDGKFGTKSGKATFFATTWPGFPETVAHQRQKYPFWVNNGRANNVWQTLYSNLRQQFVMDRFPLPFLQINPADAQRLGVTSSDLVELFNDYGNVTAMAYVSDGVKPGHTFMLFANPRGVMGSLTTDYVDPTTTIPYYKGTWAGIRKIGAQPDLAKTVTFRPLDRSRPS
jgi:arsenite oxidase large subunit